MVSAGRETSLRSLLRSAFSPARLHPAASIDRRAPNHSRLILGASIFLPANNQIPQVTRIDSQGVAHVLERKRPFPLVMENPELSFSELLPFVLTARIEITLKTSHRIGQYAAHQAYDRLDCGRAPPRWVKLCGHNGAGEIRKLIARRTHRIDLRTWIVHLLTCLDGFVRMKTHTAELFCWGRETESGCSDRVGDSCAEIEFSTLHFAGVKNDCTTCDAVATAPGLPLMVSPRLLRLPRLTTL